MVIIESGTCTLAILAIFFLGYASGRLDAWKDNINNNTNKYKVKRRCKDGG